MERDGRRLPTGGKQGPEDDGRNAHSKQRILPEAMFFLLALTLQEPLLQNIEVQALQQRIADGVLQEEERLWLREQVQERPESWAKALPHMGDFAVRALAQAAAGCLADSPLAAGLLTQGLLRSVEATALPCILAPHRVPLSTLPSLAELSLDATRPLSLRAAACARLLESGCRPAWALARSILRTGTAWDEDAPWATWPRDGRYELPKRILVLTLDSLLGEACGFEPNAPWKKQVQQLAALESRLPAALGAAAARAKVAPSVEKEQFARQVAALMRSSQDSSRLAVALLLPHSLQILRQALRHPEVAAESQRIIALTPH